MLTTTEWIFLPESISSLEESTHRGGVDAFNMNPPHTDPRAAPHLTRAVRQQISHLFPSASSKNMA